ncbi:MAG: DUF1353 domain-containing protein [Candidatus Contendobacter sp.]|nr:DUF1353 domain-containing protein [Candidatus Contendobacter sp.]
MKNAIRFWITVIAIFGLSANTYAQFEGVLSLLPPGCQTTGKCTLENKLRFTDNSNVVWEAKAGLETDGASIPPFFQPFVGKPFDESFIKAAVIHDHYCDRHVRPWRQTHRVFYEGLIDQGVSQAKAKLMYFAVYLGGPKWVELIPGKNCGKNCINALKTAAGKPVINFREADYSLFDMQAILKDLSQELEANPGALTLEQLEARAQARRPNDYYYTHGSQIQVDGSGITE